MLSYRHYTVNEVHWGCKPVLSYSKPYTISTFIEEENEKKKMHLLSLPRPLKSFK